MNKQPTLTDRIFAMFALGAIGDALGAPPEMMTEDAIAKKYGRLTTFVERKDHQFGPIAKGETTDDTQLKLAIARSIIRMRGIDLNDIAREHVVELARTTRGWGGTTREAVERLAKGIHWSQSGNLPDVQKKKRGKGNGVAMKIDPVGAFYALRGTSLEIQENRITIKDLARMTHDSAMGVAQGLAQVVAIQHCLLASTISLECFSDELTHAALIGEKVFMPITMFDDRVDILMDAGLIGNSVFSTNALDDDRLSERFRALREVTPETSDAVLRVKFGNGGCYVYESLPLAYALFLRKPRSIEALYDAVNFGGDTDTIASIVGSLLGAYNGSALIPQELWTGVDRKTEIEATVAEFVRAFSV